MLLIFVKKEKDWRQRLAKAAQQALFPDFSGAELAHLPDGRPFLTANGKMLPLFCSLTHSGGYAALAAGNFPCGVDLEFPRANRKTQAVARRFFAPEEAEMLEQEDGNLFYRMWTAKEAVLKCGGEGLSGGLASVVTVQNGALTSSITRTVFGKPTAFTLEAFELCTETGEKACGTVALTAEDQPVCYKNKAKVIIHKI